MVSVLSAILSFVLVVSLKNVQAITEEAKQELHKMMAPMIMDCAKEYNVDLEEMKKSKGASKEHDGCFLACVFKKAGVLDDKGMFSAEKEIEKVSVLAENPEEEKKIVAAVKECSSVNEEPVSDGDKGCERALKMMKCFKAQADKLGFQLGN